MALLKCKECGQDISNKATKCPNCGFSRERTSLLIKIVTIFIVMIAVSLIYTAFKSKSIPSDVTPSKVVIEKNIHVPRSTYLSINVTQYGDKWPFSVLDGTIKCTPYKNGSTNLTAVTFLANNQEYAINEAAQTVSKSFPSTKIITNIEPIWKEEPNFYKLAKEVAATENRSLQETIKKMGGVSRISLNPIIDKGLSICK